METIEFLGFGLHAWITIVTVFSIHDRFDGYDTLD